MKVVVVRTPFGKKAHLTDSRTDVRCYCGAPFSYGFDEVEIVETLPGEVCAICYAKWIRLRRTSNGSR